ncbi:hypothetical protein JOF56_003956 [Kibdelosporangium banguiense]|uniref:Tachylectin n=1 Tax=Kibdelosporangium banguiense TaxID=1365924 RepID=A0ABS4TGV2_9PSEU|nr:tachylectin-related carbohydrate-binding protein [Kibdelosporangium banguiense]MBP2323571.1 hypothetical protein [Kibdelosporangium banguiense]
MSNFVIRSDQVLDLDVDSEPEAGGGAWSGRRSIGSGWSGTTKAGPSGYVYSFRPDGEVRRLKWLGDRWENNGAFATIATGWNVWGTSSYRNRLTIDNRGDFYGIAPDNALHWWRYDNATQAWTERLLDYGWGDRFNLVASAGAGVLYARQTNGDLFRYQYDTASQRLVDFGKVGVGWQTAADVTSPGGDLLYVSDNSGAFRWYRYAGDGQWAAGSGKSIGGGIPADWQLEISPDGCKVTPDGNPVRPQVPAQPNAAASLLYTSTGRLHYSYVVGDGRMVNAQAADLSGNTPIGFSVIPSFLGVTGVPTAAEAANGRVQLLGLGTDAEVRSSTQASPTGAWSPTTKVGGFGTGPASLLRLHDSTLFGYVVDGEGCLWWTAERAQNAELRPWRLFGCDNYAPVQPTFVRGTGTTTFVTLLRRSGDYRTIVSRDGVCCPSSLLGGSGFSGAAATVVDGAGRLRVFARGADRQIYSQTETATGFPQVWTAIPGLIAAGSPSAIVAPNGTIEIVARGADGYVYNTGQVAPGSSAFRAWRDITDHTQQSSTDPTAVSVPDQNIWVVAFRDGDDVPKLRKALPPTARVASGDHEPVFVDLPVQPAQ